MPDSFNQDWKTIKAAFEASTKRKKPSEKVLGVFRKGTGIETALTAVDKAVAKKDFEEAGKLLETASKAAKAYEKTLEQAATADKDADAKKAITKMMTDLSKLIEKAKTKVANLEKIPDIKDLADFVKVMRSSAGERLTERAAKEYSSENILFLEAMAKKAYTQKTFDDFIAETGKHSINIPSKVREKFDPSDLRHAPWDDAIDVICKLLTTDVIARHNREL